MHFVEGARWAEDVAGTNAPGTALAVDHAVQIYGSEHYRRPVQPWSCSAAPVHDPVTGLLLGAIDVTGGDHVASPHVLTLVRATVAAVESELRWLHREQLAAGRPAGRRRCAPWRPRLDVLGRERARLILPSGPVELSLRHSELLLLLAEAAVAGEGRTAAQLAAECHPGDAAAVTVRAELSRLRRLVGADLVGSRPYRLLGRLDTDLDQVRRLLARGAVGAGAGALSRRGPARLARARRRRGPGAGGALLRQAVLRSRRPELLLRYAQLPEARDDVASGRPAWSGCRRARPRRAAAAAAPAAAAPRPHARADPPTSGMRRDAGSCAARVSEPPSPTTDRPPPSTLRVVVALVALALGGFAIGTTEFVTMGVLPDIADGVGVDIPTAGHLISAYALGVVVGAPVIAALSARLPRRALLVGPDGRLPGRQRAHRARARLPHPAGRPLPQPACRTAPTSASPRWSPPRWSRRTCAAGR